MKSTIPKSWVEAWDIVLTSLIGFKTLDEINRAAGCSTWVPIAFKALGYIEKTSAGYYHATSSIRRPNWAKVQQWIDKRRGANVAPKTIKSPPSCPQLFTPEKEQRNPGAIVAQPAQTYTKEQVIEAFKAFYIREYGRMDDNGYMVVGFLQEALKSE